MGIKPLPESTGNHKSKEGDSGWVYIYHQMVLGYKNIPSEVYSREN